MNAEETVIPRAMLHDVRLALVSPRAVCVYLYAALAAKDGRIDAIGPWKARQVLAQYVGQRGEYDMDSLELDGKWIDQSINELCNAGLFDEDDDPTVIHVVTGDSP